MPTETRNINDPVTGVASQVKEKVAELGRAAAATIDQNRDPAANRLESAATALKDSGENIAGAAHAAAGKLNSTADYVRQNDVDSMMDDLVQFVRKHPGPTLLVAAIGGFFLGRALTRND
ncbi:MAG: hypothetical protein ABI693_33905 [Bryobacteraceae bacterium]